MTTECAKLLPKDHKINIDVDRPVISSNSILHALCGTYRTCTAIVAFGAFLALCVYASSKGNMYGDRIGPVSHEITKRRESGHSTTFDAESLTLENCGGDSDMSCDSQFGCVTYEEDIGEVVVEIVNSWRDFMSFVLEENDVSIDGQVCLQAQFRTGGLTCIDKCDGALGYDTDSAIDREDELTGLNFCKNTFLDLMKDTLASYRRSCIASLLAQEIAVRCSRKYSSANSLEKAAFLWWKERLSVGDSWTHDQCPYYI